MYNSAWYNNCIQLSQAEKLFRNYNHWYKLASKDYILFREPLAMDLYFHLGGTTWFNQRMKCRFFDLLLRLPEKCMDQTHFCSNIYKPSCAHMHTPAVTCTSHFQLSAHSLSLSFPPLLRSFYTHDELFNIAVRIPFYMPVLCVVKK